ncbi:MAG: thermonuclease family protein [Planctomycetota bacterium]|jgi:endonuclease YncB( thermonuclease family)
MLRHVASMGLAAVLACGTAEAANVQFQKHPVREVPRGDRVVVSYAGLPVTVRLAHLVFPESPGLLSQGRDALETLLRGRQVRVTYSPQAGLDDEGRPFVYLDTGSAVVNAELIRKGLARYEHGGKPSTAYRAKMQLADAYARRKRVGIWQGGAAAATAAAKPGARRPAVSATVQGALEAGGFYSELNSSTYHVAACRWAQRMSAQRRIRYASADAAKRAGKRACFMCMSEKANKGLPGGGGKVRIVSGKGPIVGHGRAFHAPNCEKVLDKPAGELASHDTVETAKAAGLAPCDACLRLSGGRMPLPSKGECIGRSPPYRRPCRRAPADASGLCLYCQGKGN